MIAKRSALMVLLFFLPVTAFAAKRYVVKRGDNLSSLAKRFRVSLLSIKKVNGLSSDRLNVGDTILIPDSENSKTSIKQNTGNGGEFDYSAQPVVSATESEQKEPAENQITTNRQYVVVQGDTLSGIGKKFGVSSKDIIKQNNLKNTNLRIGQRLTLPYRSNKTPLATGHLSQEEEPVSLNVNETTRYVVKRGDNLSLIAERFDVSVEDLKNVNHIRRNSLRAGQVISIPNQNRVVKLSVESINIGHDQNKTSVNTKIKTDDHQENASGNGGISRDSIIKIAKRFLGIPYKFGGTSPIKGLDCSAFVGQVFSFLNVDLPRTARELFGVGRHVNRSQLAAGDLVFFRTYARYPSHVGIYVGDSEFIHASSKAHMVTIDSMDRPYFLKRYIGARRIEKAGLFYGELSQDYKGFERQ